MDRSGCQIPITFFRIFYKHNKTIDYNESVGELIIGRKSLRSRHSTHYCSLTLLSSFLQFDHPNSEFSGDYFVFGDYLKKLTIGRNLLFC